MMKQRRSQIILVGVVATLTFLMGVLLSVTPALAETLKVSGADYVYADGKDTGGIDVLTVTGQKGQTVYVNLTEKSAGGNKTLASHLAYALDDPSGETDANGDTVGVVSINVSPQALINSGSTYAIEVFADRAETTPLYSGTISILYAKLGENAPEPLMVRTLSQDENRPMEVPQTVSRNGAAYKLASPDPTDVGGKPTYVYELSNDIANETEAHVTYYAEGTDTVIKTDSATIRKGESSTLEVPAIVSGTDGKIYRTLFLSDAVTLSYPGVTEYAVMCHALSSEWGSVGSFFEAKLRYVDASGESLGVADTVLVNKDYTYTAPTYLYITKNGTVKEYILKDQSTAKLTLSPGQAEGTQTFDFAYDVLPDTAERTWTVILENGSVSPTDPNRVIDRITYRGVPGTTVEHKTQQELTVGEKAYIPTAQAQQTYSHTFAVADAEVEQVIYYVPKDYVPPEAYDLTVKYVNIATNEVIDTQTYTASPSMRADLELTSPESFTKNGIEWVRLDGQEMSIRHGFYSPAREYVVYYRDINDDLHATTVIRNVRVVYVDEQGNTVSRPTTVVDNGTTTTTGATTTEGGATPADAGTAAGAGTATDAGTAAGTGAAADAGTAAAAGPTDTGLPTGGNLVAIDGAEGQTTVGQDGTDLATQRIEDDTTPLAGPSSNKGLPNQAALIGGISAAVAAALGIVLFFVFKRRKQNKTTDESSTDDHTA